MLGRVRAAASRVRARLTVGNARALLWRHKGKAALAAGGLLLAARQRAEKVSLPDAYVLHIPLNKPVDNRSARVPGDVMPEQNSYNLADTVLTMAEAAGDRRCKGVSLVVGPGCAMSLATAYELREAVEKMRVARAKFDPDGDDFEVSAYVYSSDSPSAYIFAGAADTLMINAGGFVGLHDVSAETLYFRRFLDERLGLRADVVAQGRFKSFGEMLSRDGPSKNAKQNLQQIVDSLSKLTTALVGLTFSRAAEPVAVETSAGADAGADAAADADADAAVAVAKPQRPKFGPDAAREVLRGGPYTAREAVEAGLADRVASPSEYLQFLRDKYGAGDGKDNGTRLVKLERRNAVRVESLERRRSRSRPEVALLTFDGQIGEFSESLAFATLLRRAARDPRTHAVLLRVNSPGGDVTGSRVLRDAVEATVRDGTPVIVSMGDTAASGGYMMSAPASRVLATPMTLTGSIGVVTTLFSASEALRRLGITVNETLGEGQKHSPNLSSPLRRRTRRDLEVMDRVSGAMYDDFVSAVAADRGLSEDAVRLAAEGRVWLGDDAVRLGLVDGRANLWSAAGEACRAAGYVRDTGKIKAADVVEAEAEAEAEAGEDAPERVWPAARGATPAERKEVSEMLRERGAPADVEVVQWKDTATDQFVRALLGKDNDGTMLARAAAAPLVAARWLLGAVAASRPARAAEAVALSSPLCEDDAWLLGGAAAAPAPLAALAAAALSPSAPLDPVLDASMGAAASVSRRSAALPAHAAGPGATAEALARVAADVLGAAQK